MKNLLVLLAHLLTTIAKLLGPGGAKAVPYAPFSHPFVERLIGTIRHKYLDHVLFWNAIDLEKKLAEFQVYFNRHRVHSSLGGGTPAEVSEDSLTDRAELDNFRWQDHCRGLYQLPVAA